MKRLAKIARRTGLAAILTAIILVSVMPVFAMGGGPLDFTSNSDGMNNMPIENVGIKLFFNEGADVVSPEVWSSNEKQFKMTGYVVDPEDETKTNQVNVPVIAYPGQKENEKNYILVLADPASAGEGASASLVQKTDYVLEVGADIQSVDGRRLGEARSVKFTTLDVSANSRLSMLVMVLMMVAVIVLMVVNNIRKSRAEAEAVALLNANPYRLAKERKITVDEAKALIDKAKEKNAKLLAKVGGKAPEPEPPKSSVPRIESRKKEKPPTHKVHGAKSAFDGGSKYAAQKKAEAFEKRKAAAAKKAAQARQQNKNKSGGGGKNKKK